MGRELPVSQRDHPVGGIGLLLALDFLSCRCFKCRCQVAQVGIEFLEEEDGKALEWSDARPASSQRAGVAVCTEGWPPDRASHRGEGLAV